VPEGGKGAEGERDEGRTISRGRVKGRGVRAWRVR
jgi:hypothetical protein